MNANDLTRGDLDVLFEAVEKWERDDVGPEMMLGILGGMASSSSPEAAAKIEQLQAEREAKRKAAAKLRRERGVLLRAKLIKIRDGMDAAAFANSAD